MATFNNGESGLSVRTKINNVLQHLDGTSGSVVVNDAGADVDFRVESDTNPNALFVDGASGNVGIGVTPSAWGANYKAIQFPSGGTAAFGLTNIVYYQNAYDDGVGTWKYSHSGLAAGFYNQSLGSHAWYTAPSGTAGQPITFTQAMTLDAAGNLGVGTTAAAYAVGEKVSVINTSGNNGVGIAIGNTNNVGLGIYSGYTATGTATAIQFQDHNSIVRGSITVTTSSTAYNTSSDYRLKEDVQPIADASSRLALLNPVNFAWKTDGFRTDGFIAHEVQAVIPQAVTGEKDAVDENGNPVYQGIDHSKLVPLLTAALQEAMAKIEALEARITALEA